jgi:hypothetical protein
LNFVPLNHHKPDWDLAAADLIYTSPWRNDGAACACRHSSGDYSSSLQWTLKRYAACKQAMLNMTNENQAVWEMTQLIIAPKKVFRNIYYHVSLIELIPHSFMNIADNNHRNVRCKTMDYNCNQRANDPYRNKELVSSSGSGFHISAFAILPNDWRGLGISIRRWRWPYDTHRLSLRPWSLSWNFLAGLHTHVLPCWTSPWEAKARSLRSAHERRRGTRVWILL